MKALASEMALRLLGGAKARVQSELFADVGRTQTLNEELLPTVHVHFGRCWNSSNGESLHVYPQKSFRESESDV